MQLTNKHNLPLSVAVFLASDEYDHSSEPWTISATTLLKSIRQIVLSARLDVEDVSLDVSEVVASRLGSAYHSAVETSWKAPQTALTKLGIPERVQKQIHINPAKPTGEIDIYLEQRSCRKLGRWTVSGKFDMVMDGQLEDFKSTSVHTYLNQTNADKYILQGSIYKWLNPDIITGDHLQINYLFTNWQSHQAQGSSEYPKMPVLSQKYPLKGTKETELWVRHKLDQLDKYWETKEEELPLCNDEELWRREDVWKYYGKADAQRASKVFDDPVSANAWLADKGKGVVKKVPGEVVACKYCPAFALCSQKDDLIARGELKL